MSKILFGLVTMFVVGLLTTSLVFAQVGSSGVAVSVPVQGEDVSDASLVCSGEGGFVECSELYDSSIYGVITDDPAAVFEGGEFEGSRPVMSTGTAVLRVSAVNGAIVVGDLLTSSEIPGVAVKADQDGFVIGAAMEEFDPVDSNAEGLILISLNIHPTIGLSGAASSLLTNLGRGLSLPVLNPLVSLRYLLAFAIVVIGFTVGFVNFGRVGRAGIEAIGRNPLARRAIQLSVFINIALGIVIIVGSLVIAALILIF